MTGIEHFNEAEVRDAFGRVVRREGSFTVEIPMEIAKNGGTVLAPDGSLITVTPDPDDGLHVTGEEARS